MATVNILIGRVSNVRRNANTMPVLDAAATSEDITSSGTSQATTAAAPKDGTDYYVQITTTGDIRIAVGEGPTAVDGQGPLILANTTRDFALPPGFKVAVIDEGA